MNVRSLAKYVFGSMRAIDRITGADLLSFFSSLPRGLLSRTCRALGGSSSGTTTASTALALGTARRRRPVLLRSGAASSSSWPMSIATNDAASLSADEKFSSSSDTVPVAVVTSTEPCSSSCTTPVADGKRLTRPSSIGDGVE